MQGRDFSATAQVQMNKVYGLRTGIAGIFLLAIPLVYLELVEPATSSVQIFAGYRFPFSFETSFYILFFAAYAVHFAFRLVRPVTSVASDLMATTSWNYLGMGLRTVFLLLVAASYLTGAMIATPSIFSPLTSITGPTLEFANFVHDTAAYLLITFGIAIVVYELVKISRKKSTFRSWLWSARYPEIKFMYWVIAIGVIAQGILGLFLLGTISPYGPFALVGNNSYSFESLVRHLHGPMGAVLISLFFGHVYLRIRPEYSVK
jgi:hypothetical protein